MAKSVPYWQLCELVSPEGAALLCDKYGGTELYIPVRHGMRPSHRLWKMLGENALYNLSDAYGGYHIEIPMARFYNRAEILAHVQSGKLSKQAAARVLKLTTRRIRQIMSDTAVRDTGHGNSGKKRRDDRQVDLIDYLNNTS